MLARRLQFVVLSDMSFRDFDRGLTADEVRQKHLTAKAESIVADSMRKWLESEHVLNMLRTIKSGNDQWKEMEEQAWQKFLRCHR